MLRVIAIFLFLAPALGFAQQQPVTFSSFAPSLKLDSVTPDGAVAKFVGTVTVSGIIYFEFDRGDSGRMVGVNFAKFVPDNASLSRLPAITAGYFPAPVNYVLLEPAEAALIGAFGPEEARRLSNGVAPFSHKRVRVVMRNYTASVECDSREYMSIGSVVRPLGRGTFASLARAPAGC